MRANREHPPDYLVGDAPFHDLDRHITRAELRWLSEGYKRITGFALEDVR